MAKCKRCGQEIGFEKSSAGRWYPVELDAKGQKVWESNGGLLQGKNARGGGHWRVHRCITAEDLAERIKHLEQALAEDEAVKADPTNWWGGMSEAEIGAMRHMILRCRYQLQEMGSGLGTPLAGKPLLETLEFWAEESGKLIAQGEALQEMEGIENFRIGRQMVSDGKATMPVYKAVASTMGREGPGYCMSTTSQSRMLQYIANATSLAPRGDMRIDIFQGSQHLITVNGHFQGITKFQPLAA